MPPHPSPHTHSTTLQPAVRVHRVEVRATDQAGDPRAARLERDATDLGSRGISVRVVRVYFIEAALDDDQLAMIASGLLADPVAEVAHLGTSKAPSETSVIEVHPLPGIMDPAALTVAQAVEDLTGVLAVVLTGWRYELSGVNAEGAQRLIEQLVANRVIHDVHAEAYWPAQLPKGQRARIEPVTVAIRELDDDALLRLSRDGHLFLDLVEMRAITEHYRALERDPTEIELESLAQTWSEHCVHKTLKSTIHYRDISASADGVDPLQWEGRPGHTVHEDGSVTIHNLLKSTVAAATHELIANGIDWCLSVFDDNSGVIALDDKYAVCIKVETHNHPSAIEPYGGAATGIGGCIRDIIGTGLGAKPIASSDVFCVGYPDIDTVPEGCIPPARVLTEIVAGVRDYGNRMGIPTVNGAVWYDNRYVGNPLVYVGCVGIMPRNRIKGEPRAGDLIVALGGRTGRDGIHGATFSSAELSDSHADEFGHAVQIGNAIEEKRMLDAILRARDDSDEPLFSAITDCGAGGFSSAVGEMGETLGALVQLDQAPLKYDGLTPTETWISEAQERMVLAVPEANLERLREICDQERTELAVLGTFGTPNAELILRHGEVEVGRLSMDFLHNGVPSPTRTAEWNFASSSEHQNAAEQRSLPTTQDALLGLLAHPIIASKQHIIRQYDHEVQGNTIVRPMVGSGTRGKGGPGDAAVIEPVPGSGRGISLACGLATGLERDPYLMTLAAIDEAVRNSVCVGADPSRIAILDNFCWPSCAKPENLGSLVRAAEGCYDGAKAYRTPFVSGKDSLNNQFTTADGVTIEIPPTLLITALGIVPNLERATTSDAKRAGNVILLAGATSAAGGGSMYERLFGLQDAKDVLQSVASSLGDKAHELLDSLPDQTRVDLERLVEHASGRVPADRLESLRDKTWTKLRGMVGNEAWGRLERRLGSDRLHEVAARVVEVVGNRISLHAALPVVDLRRGPLTAQIVSEQIAAGRVASSHDCSEGGLLVALAEMLIGGGGGGGGARSPIGCELVADLDGLEPAAFCFAETPSRYVLEVASTHVKEIERAHIKAGIECRQIGVLDHSGSLRCEKLSLDVSVETLAEAWAGV